MKTSVLTFILALSLSSAFAQWGNNKITLSSNITTEVSEVTDFDKIDVSEDFKVYVRVSDSAEEVKIQANENLHELIQVEKKGRAIKIYTDPYSYSYNSRKKGSAKEVLVAYIAVRSLSEIKASEDVIVVLEDKIHAEDLTIKLAEDCILEGELEVNNLYVKLAEDCVLDIEGSAKNMEAQADEDSTIRGKKFIVNDLTLDLNEDSVAKLTVNGNISLNAREDSSFSYRGDGKFIHKKLREDSEVRHW